MWQRERDTFSVARTRADCLLGVARQVTTACRDTGSSQQRERRARFTFGRCRCLSPPRIRTTSLRPSASRLVPRYSTCRAAIISRQPARTGSRRRLSFNLESNFPLIFFFSIYLFKFCFFNEKPIIIIKNDILTFFASATFAGRPLSRNWLVRARGGRERVACATYTTYIYIESRVARERNNRNSPRLPRVWIRLSTQCGVADCAREVQYNNNCRRPRTPTHTHILKYIF